MLKSKQGYTIGYSLGANYTPLEWLQRSNPKKDEMPRGFRLLLTETCPLACYELKQGRTVFGFRFRDIIESKDA